MHWKWDSGISIVRNATAMKTRLAMRSRKRSRQGRFSGKGPKGYHRSDDRIREDDRINLIGLRDLAPGKPVECRIAHADGTTEIVQLAHTFAASQLEWFRRGSALNLFHRV